MNDNQAGACPCTASFGRIVWSPDCTDHERCPVTMQGVPIQCILTKKHTGTHR